MDRRRYNRDSSKAQYDIYKIEDLRIDHEYLNGKARDIWTVAANPPYIKSGGEVEIAANPLKVNIAAVTAFDSEFREINATSVSNYSLHEYTPNVNNYLTVHYTTIDDVTSLRTTYKNITLSYDAYVKDSFAFQWKLSAPIEPQITGLTSEPFHIIKDVNDKIKFSTDQSLPEYNVLLISNVASITGDDIGSGSVIVYNGYNNLLNFVVDTFSYSINITPVVSGELFTLSGLATRINTNAFAQNFSLVDPIAFAIEDENKIRITSPRDLTAIGLKKVLILSGSANTLLGFSENDISSEVTARTAQNIVDEINTATSPELTASIFGLTRVKLQAQDPAGYIQLISRTQNTYSTLGLTPSTIYGAEQVDFDNDIILTTAKINTSGSLELNTINRTQTFKIVEGNVGWKETFDFIIGSGDVIYEETFTLVNNYYIVGSQELEVHSNGKYLHIGRDYDEIGTVGNRSVEFIVYQVINGDRIEARIPKSSPSNFRSQTISRDSSVVQLGFTGLDFGPEFSIVGNTSGGVTINAGQFSGAVMDHAFNHEFGGNDELNVDNLTGLLLRPQKTNFYSEGALIYSRTGINISGAGVSIRDVPTSGFVDINIPETQLVNIDGDTIIRLGRNDATVFSELVVQDTTSGNLWVMYVDNYGQLATQLTDSGIPFAGVLQSDNSSKWILDIEVVFGSGEIKTSLTPTGTAVDFALQAPNGAAWDVKVMNDGTVYTIDRINKFQIRDGQNEPLFTISEDGNNYISGNAFTFNITELDFTSNLIHLNTAQTTGSGIASLSGGIVIHRGTADPAVLLYDETKGGWVINPPERKLIATQNYVDDSVNAMSGVLGNLIIANDMIDALTIQMIDQSGTIIVQAFNELESQFYALSGYVTTPGSGNIIALDNKINLVSGTLHNEINTLSLKQIYANNNYGVQVISNGLAVYESGIVVSGAITGGVFTDTFLVINGAQSTSGVTGNNTGLIMVRGSEPFVIFGFNETRNKMVLSTDGTFNSGSLLNIATEDWTLSTLSSSLTALPHKYVHPQLSPSTNWNVNHALNTLDYTITVFDASNNMLVPLGVSTIDANNVTVSFTLPTDGKAVIIG